MAAGSSLSNHLLVAMPSLDDPDFAQSVTLVCEHSAEKGALGIVINKPLPMTLGEVFEQMRLEPVHPSLGAAAVLRGGPVHRDRGFVVHRPGGDWDSSHLVSEGVQVTTSRDVLAAMARGEGPRDAFNAWFSLPVDHGILFDTPFEDRWQAVWRQLGIDVGRVSHVAGHA
jgi:putative transcriptional regulator